MQRQVFDKIHRGAISKYLMDGHDESIEQLWQIQLRLEKIRDGKDLTVEDAAFILSMTMDEVEDALKENINGDIVNPAGFIDECTQVMMSLDPLVGQQLEKMQKAKGNKVLKEKAIFDELYKKYYKCLLASKPTLETDTSEDYL